MYSWEIYFSCKSLPELNFKFNEVSVKIQGEYFLDSDKQILKYNDQDLKRKYLIIPLHILQSHFFLQFFFFYK